MGNEFMDIQGEKEYRRRDGLIVKIRNHPTDNELMIVSYRKHEFVKSKTELGIFYFDTSYRRER